jgi:LysR family hca operon transcriptional activator
MHKLAGQKAIGVQDLVGETFLSVSGTAVSAPGRQLALRLASDRYIKKSGINIKPSHTVDGQGAIMSLSLRPEGSPFCRFTPGRFLLVMLQPGHYEA